MKRIPLAAAALALGGAVSAATPPGAAPNDGGAGKGRAAGFLGEAAQHCDPSHNPAATFNLAAWILYSLQTTDGVSEKQSNAWIMEGGQAFDDSVAKNGLKLACEAADREAARWGASQVVGKAIADRRAKAPARADDSVLMDTFNGQTFVSVGLGSQSVKMMIDTGSNIMSVPAKVAERLLASGGAERSKSYHVRQANGAIVHEDGIIIHRVTLGSHVVRDVAASIAPNDSTPLLPTTVLSRIGKFTIDSANNKLSFN